MGGTIWVESTAGQGSTFHFHARFGLQEQPRSRHMFTAQELLGIRVLVVDDNASARDILSGMVKNFGMTVALAHNGAQALELVAASDKSAQPFDLVLMDWKMPTMDGIEAMRQLRSQQLSQVPAVIMATAYGRDDAMALALENKVGLQTVLTKPVTASTLFNAIGEALGKRAVAIGRQAVRSEEYALAIAQLRGARVLLVEDNDMNQELAMELLTGAGMQVVLASHGQQALDILARDPHFDGVLMDCQMPVMDGYIATQEIRKNPACKDLPIIAMTANAMAGDKEKVLQAGMLDHVAKPLNMANMFATMAKWIKPAAASARAASPENAVPAPPREALAGGFLNGLHLPGIDTRSGLAVALHREALYQRFLLKFRDSQEKFADMFTQARLGPDGTAAQRCAHTLGGSAANVGATRVQEAAQRLEQGCKRQLPQAQIDGLLAEVMAELLPVLEGLQALRTKVPVVSPQAPVAVDQALVADLHARLLQLLAQGDSRAIRLCDEHQAVLAAAAPLHWPKIADCLHSFDFESARALLQTIGLQDGNATKDRS
jgi:CheY-like chemotaxis protein